MCMCDSVAHALVSVRWPGLGEDLVELVGHLSVTGYLESLARAP